MKNIKILILSFLHLIVDGICGYIIINYLYDKSINSLVIFFLYNSLAFLLQPFVGFLFDKLKSYSYGLLISSLLLIIGVLSNKTTILSTIMLGLGNCIFHIAGGKYTTEAKENDPLYLGLFVSLGGIGLALGCYIKNISLLYTFIALLIIGNLLFFLIRDKNYTLDVEKKYSCQKKDIIYLILVLFVVLIRAFVGKTINFDWNINTKTALIIAIVSTSGKLFGGIFTKFFKITKTTFISLILSCILLFIPNQICNLIGLCLFNFTMPITLYLSNRLLKNYSGLSFGLLAFMLFPGYLLGCIEIMYIVKVILIILCIFTSLVLIIFIDKKVDDLNA